MMDISYLQNHCYFDEGKAYYGNLEGIAPITLWIWLSIGSSWRWSSLFPLLLQPRLLVGGHLRAPSI